MTTPFINAQATQAIIHGLDSNNDPLAIKIDADGKLLVQQSDAPSAVRSQRVSGNTETLVAASRLRLLAVIGNTGSSGTAAFVDADETGTGDTALIDIAAAAGDSQDCFGIVFEEGLTFVGSAAGTDVTVIFEEVLA